LKTLYQRRRAAGCAGIAQAAGQSRSRMHGRWQSCWNTNRAGTCPYRIIALPGDRACRAARAVYIAECKLELPHPRGTRKAHW